MGLRGVHGLVELYDFPSNNADPVRAYLLPGATPRAWMALGSDDVHPPPPTWIKDGYLRVVCTNPNFSSVTWTGPKNPAKISVPPDDPRFSNAYLQWPTVTVSGIIHVPRQCHGSANGLETGTHAPNMVIYFCYIAQRNAKQPNPWSCGSVYAGVVLPTTRTPGPVIPNNGRTVTVYQWESTQELKYIKAHGKLEAAPNHVGEYVFATKDDAEAAANLYEGYHLVRESFDEGSLVDYSVGIVGISDGLGYFIPQELMDALFGIAEVAG